VPLNYNQMQYYRIIHNSLHATELIESVLQWLQRHSTWLTAMIWEGYLAIDTGTRKIWIPWWNLIFNFRGQNISLEQSRLTSQCFPIINVSDYTCLTIGNVDHINSYFLLTNLTTIGLFEWGQTIKSFIEEPTRCNNNNLLISKISSTCFGQSFAHLHERKTETFTEYGRVSCCGRQGFGERQRGTMC
jgi:hypothetical protein